MSENGKIHVNWDYRHTGGLNLTEVSIQYGQEQVEDFQFLSVVSDSEERLQERKSTTAVNFTAGYNYIFRISVSNTNGSDSTECPSILHTIGNDNA